MRQCFGDRLALLSGRPAFAGSFVAIIQGRLTAALRDLKQTDREAFSWLDEAVPEVEVLMDSRLNPFNSQLPAVLAVCKQITDYELLVELCCRVGGVAFGAVGLDLPVGRSARRRCVGEGSHGPKGPGWREAGSA